MNRGCWMMGNRERLTKFDEQDAVTGWRHVVYWQRGELRRVKRRMSKRARARVRRELRMGEWNHEQPNA